MPLAMVAPLKLALYLGCECPLDVYLKQKSCLAGEFVTSSNSFPTESECSSFEYTCSDGECIPAFWECDNFDDCSDAGDEADCSKCLSK